ncbi:hypothetical protein AK812_SmicGene39032 [Symbiodinium microadriaticum]|uniref:Uncharacterized protein n=1 Tax=Symbiodinium microadriaticum TaxID=2951 RepID=A0A1Q9CC92_SYMMI|nr:hypothetical protein AK812_SmicGene39032 [Symbiodinium microadriaticum]
MSRNAERFGVVVYGEELRADMEAEEAKPVGRQVPGPGQVMSAKQNDTFNLATWRSLQIADVSFGRGLVVSSAVAQGELLVVCQALVLAPQDELQVAALEKLKTCSEEEYKNFMCLQGGADELQQASTLVSTSLIDILSALPGDWLALQAEMSSLRPAKVAEQFLGDLLLLRASKPMVAGEVQWALEQLDSLTANSEKKTLPEVIADALISSAGIVWRVSHESKDGRGSFGPRQALEGYSVCTDLLAKPQCIMEACALFVPCALDIGDRLAGLPAKCHFSAGTVFFEVCEALAAKAGWPQEMLDAVSSSLTAIQKADLDSSAMWKYVVENEKTFVTVNIMLPEGIEPTDVNIDLAPEKVCVASAGYPDLTIDLPVPADA